MRETAEKIFLAGVERVLPDKLIRSRMQLSGDVLTICGNNYNLRNIEHVYVIGAGKAAALMSLETEQILGSQISAGHVVTKYGHGCNLQRIHLSEAAHPVPDENGVKATAEIFKIARKAKKNDLVICLISGGASALLADVPPGISLDDLGITNKLLMKSGANIHEINTIRKHLSEIKGGQLAKIIYPATCISLILSDVVGDPLDVIASGPTAPDTSSFDDAYDIMKQYELHSQLPDSIIKHLLLGKRGIIPETPDKMHRCFQTTQNYIVGSNKIALEAAAEFAKREGYQTHIITDSLQEDYKQVAGLIISTVKKHLENKTDDRPICLLFGGEPTVKIEGNGLGGRNQHLALYLSTRLENMPGITILCAGTDGTDGPTDAAGAVVDSTTVESARSNGLIVSQYLEKSDSYNFFSKTGGHIFTKPTQTNVMDMIVVIIDQQKTCI
ncbi:MAG: glycerate kinase [Paludibacter sp.]|nr:glycerate kinase [Paludibacter sp.]